VESSVLSFSFLAELFSFSLLPTFIGTKSQEKDQSQSPFGVVSLDTIFSLLLLLLVLFFLVLLYWGGSPPPGSPTPWLTHPVEMTPTGFSI